MALNSGPLGVYFYLGTARQYLFSLLISLFSLLDFYVVCLFFWCEGVNFYSGIDETMALGHCKGGGLLGALLTPPMATVPP